jgi:ribosome-binding ATPase YchF (GTP1/OBG family)
MGLDKEQMELLKPLCLITAKPAMYVANVSDTGFKNNPLLDQLTEYANSQHAPIVAICAALEAEIADLDDEDKGAFLADMGMTEPGLNRVIRAAYTLLGLQTYFTAGEKEIRAWTIGKGWTAPQAAGVIHTDFEKGFIKAEVYSIEDLETYKSEAAMKRRSVRSAKPSMEAAAERRVSAEPAPVLSSIWAVALRASLTAVTASLMVGNMIVISL